MQPPQILMTTARTQAESRLILRPNSAPQRRFFAASESDVLYGGAAGSGKSWALVVDPMRYIGVADYTHVIFRRTFPELEGSIIPLAHKYYPLAGGVWSEQKKTYTFPSGAFIRLAFMQHENDWTNYQGHEYAGQSFDEATNFRPIQIESLMIWNRSRCSVKPYRRFATNPGGVAHKYIKSYFVDVCMPQPDGPQRFSKLANLWWQPMKPGPAFVHTDATTGRKLTRLFIPARVFDNEDLLRNNPDYIASLLQLPEHRRRQYVEGDWEVFEGQFFDLKPEVHVIPPIRKIHEDWMVLGGLDYGSTTVLLVGYRDHEGNIVIFHEHLTTSTTPSERANSMAESLLERGLKNLRIAYDTNMDLNLRDYIGYDKSPVGIFREVFEQRMGKAAPTMAVVSKATTDRRGYRIVKNEAIKEFMRYQYGSDGRLTIRPRLYITSNCKYLLDTMPDLVHDPDSPEGLDFNQKIGEDHAVDALGFVVLGLMRPASAQPKKVKSYSSFDDYMEEEVFAKIRERAMSPKVNPNTL